MTPNVTLNATPNAAAGAPAPRRLVVDAAGRLVRFGAELGRGGEGNVYALADAPELVAKLYHSAPDAEKAAKLAAMVRGASAALTDVAAWPTGTLHPAGSATADGGVAADAPVLGIVMPRATGAPIHRLYSPVSRRAEFPAVDWQRLVIVAHNLAAAVAQVHAAGHVIGDVNQGNALVAADGRVRLIDCDSLQVRDPGGRDGTGWFPCEVGVAHFTPPELQGQSFAGVVRTPNHDAFGLAVLVFHLLFMGRHPFAGRYTGPGDMPIERAITEFRFAFGRHAAALRMAPPPHALPLAGASPAVAELFERAFGPDGGRDGARPTAAEWKSALGRLAREVAACPAVPTHTYPPTLGACPWCAIARAGGPDFFAATATTGRSLGAFNAAHVWAAIRAVPAPKPRAQLPVLPTVAHVPAHPLPGWRSVVWWTQLPVAAAAGVAGFAGVVGSSGTPAVATAAGLALLVRGLRRGSGLVEERRRRERALEVARTRLREAEARWTRELGSAGEQFRLKSRHLEALQSEYQDLDAARQRRWQALEARRRDHQLRQHLERHAIADGGVPGIGPGLTAALAARGVRTAADVTPAAVEAVPGLGARRARELVAWRRSVESTFVVDPSQGVDPAEVVALDAHVTQRRAELERALAAGPGALRQLGTSAERLCEQLTRELETQQVAVGVAEADFAAAGGPFPAQYRAPAGVAALFIVLMLMLVDLVPDSPDDDRALAERFSPPVTPMSAVAPAPEGVLSESQVEKQAGLVPGTLAPRYPAQQLAEHREGSVIVQFVVDTTGLAELRTLRVLYAADPDFAWEAQEAVARARFSPAEVAGRKVRQLVRLPIEFTLGPAARRI